MLDESLNLDLPACQPAGCRGQAGDVSQRRPAMGRSSKKEAARTRTRIVEAASELFRTAGVDQVSVADLMGSLGMTTGGFYKHFASKEALVAEAIGLAFEQSASAWRQLAQHEDGKTPARCCGSLVAHYLRPNPKGRCPMIAFAAHAASGNADAEARQVYRQGSETLLDRFIETAARATAGGAASAVERNAMLLFAAMIGARMMQEAAGDTAWADMLRDVVLDAATTAA
jgi:TetR/AcrR family transcriptional repressor of nem operon